MKKLKSQIDESDDHRFPVFISNKSSFLRQEKKHFTAQDFFKCLADTRPCARISLTGPLAVDRSINCSRFSVTWLQCNKSSPEFLSMPCSLYLRGWWREWRGKEEDGLEDEEGEQGDMEAREAVAAASSASSSSPPWSSWLTLDCKAAGVSHSLGRQLWRNGTQELK